MNEMFSQGGKGSTGILTNKQAVARHFGVKQSEVVYFSVGVDLGGYKVIYDKDSQRAYSLPIGIPAGTTAISLSTAAILVHSAGSVDLGALAVSREEYVTLSGSFDFGATLNVKNELLTYTDGKYRWDGAFPKTVAAGSTPMTTGGVGIGAWLSVGDTSLRSNLKSSDLNLGDALVTVKKPLPLAVARSLHSVTSEYVSVFDFPGVVGDGVNDDTNGILAALSSSKHVYFPNPPAHFVMKAQMVLEGHTLLADGIGRMWGNTGVEIRFSGFDDDFAIVSKDKTNFIKGFLFRPEVRSNAPDYGLHIQRVIHMADSAIVGFSKSNVKGWEDVSLGYEPWGCTFHNCFFLYAGEHNVVMLQGCNAYTFVDCSTSWAGAPDIGVAATTPAEFYGWYVSQDASLAPVPYPTQPEGLWISGGDSSYNAGGSFFANKGFGLDVNLTYSELNKTCCLNLGGTLAASHFRIGRATESLVTSLPVVTDPTTPFPGTSIYPARDVNQIYINGRDFGTGMKDSVNGKFYKFENEPITVMSSAGAPYIAKIPNTSTGGFELRGSEPGLQINLNEVNLVSSTFHNLPVKLKNLDPLPVASAAYEDAIVSNHTDKKAYVCMWNGTAYQWFPMN
ncbi:tail fibers protein [Salmonella phage vB_SenM_UTK0005]|nr:tail fibers protein [Salmonella phage vB_SenM_UTK0005]